MSKFLGLDFLFARKEYIQSIQTDSQDRKVLVNSALNGDILAVRQVPNHLLNKPWFESKVRYPRHYLGISKLEERIKKLSYLVHVLTRNGIPTRSVLKSVNRLCCTWFYTKYEDMRKHVQSLTLKVKRSGGETCNPSVSRKDLPKIRRIRSTDKIHESGLVTQVWVYPPLFQRG